MNDKKIYDKFIQKKTTHKSENTTNAYIIETRMFFRFINNEYQSLYAGYVPEEITEYNFCKNGSIFNYDLVDSYRDFLLTNYASSSVQKKLSMACNLIKFLGLNGVVADTSFLSSIEDVRVFRKDVKFLTAPQRRQLIESLEGANTKESYRDYVMIMTILTIGLRGFEVRGLQISNIDWDNKTITFYGKGDEKTNVREDEIVKSTVIVSDFLLNLFKTYIEKYRYTPPSDYKIQDILFPSKYGKMMSQKSLGNLVRKRLRLAGFDENVVKDITPHKIRATFITSLVEKNIHPLVIKDLARHQSLTTTTRYTGLDLNLGKDIMNSLMSDYYNNTDKTGGI